MLTPRLQPRPLSKKPGKRSLSSNSIKDSDITKACIHDLSKSLVFQRRPLVKLAALDKIRVRNSQPEVEVTPDLAVRVTREFILPMFKLDRQQQAARQRVKSTSLGNSEQFSGGVFTELKLSDTLHLELKEARSQVEDLKRKLRIVMQHEEQVTNDVSSFQIQNATLTSHLHVLRLQYNDLLIENQRISQSQQGNDEQTEDFLQQLSILEDKNLGLVSEIQSEREKNDIRLERPAGSLTAHTSCTA
jgi:hypothetical protein